MPQQDLEGGEQSDSNDRVLEINVSKTSIDDSDFSGSDSLILNFTFDAQEESKVVQILDRRLLLWVLFITFVLNMDRTNISNAVSDNLPIDLGFTTDTVNLGTAIYSIVFSLACLSGAVVCKIINPARCECTPCIN